MLISDRASKFGASFTAFTVTSKDRLKVALSPAVFMFPSSPPSSIVTVTVAVPFWLATGVKARLPDAKIIFLVV